MSYLKSNPILPLGIPAQKENTMTDSKDQVQSGLALLALFSPAQVACIARAVGEFGGDVMSAAERFQVDNCYPNNAFGALDPNEMRPEWIAEICPVVGAIWKDALVDKWTEEELKLTLKQSTGVSDSIASEVVKGVILPEDSELTRMLINTDVFSQISFGLIPMVAKMLDDYIDDVTGITTGSNLYMFSELGKRMRQLNKRAKMMVLEYRSERQGAARVDQEQIVQAKRSTLGPTVRSVLKGVLAFRDILQFGKSETGEPYDSNSANVEFHELNQLLREGIRLLDQQPADGDEVGGFMGDIAKYTNKAKNKLKKLFGKSEPKVKSHSVKKMAGQTMTRVDAVRRSKDRLREPAPRNAMQLEAILSD
jgi:hypothetical protein